MVNLDNTKALKKIAEELGAIDQTLNSLMVITAGVAAQNTEPGKTEAEPTGAEKVQGVPILLIVEVLISLIRLLRAFSVHDGNHAMAIRLHELTRKLEPYQPVRPQVCLDGEEAE